MSKYKFVPVNQSVLVKPISEEEYKEITGENKEENKKVGSIFIPDDVKAKEKGGMVRYAKGRVVQINETEELPFKLKSDDIIVYNVGATLTHDALGESNLEMVKLTDIIVTLTEEK